MKSRFVKSVVAARFAGVVKTALASISVVLIYSNLHAGDGVLLKSLPPVVLKTFPVSGYDKVDPDTKTIRVVFNKKMTDKSWSFVQIDKKSFPELVGTPFFDNKRHTCSVNVHLAPSTTYIIWINKGIYQNFRDIASHPSVPYLLAFRTAGKDFVVKKKEALMAANIWLASLDSAKFADTWKAADDYFKKRVKESLWVRQMPQLAQKLGKFVSRKLLSANFTDKLPGLPGRGAFVLRFAARYERKPNTVETLVPILGTDGVWRVSGYYIK